MGPPGKPGEKGADGRDGRDGAAITKEQLEALREHHAKELDAQFKSFVDSFVLDGRAIKVGEKVIGKWNVPLFCGVWKDGTKYEPGDLVTWGGSLWHCDLDTLERPGEGKLGWTLAVKHGRDASR